MSDKNEHIDDGFLNKDGLKDTPFSTPENYFDGLGDRLSMLKENPESLNISKETPFSVPDNYFDQIQAKNFMKTAKSGAGYWYVAMSVAAIFLVCFAIFGNFNASEQQSTHQTTASIETNTQDDWDVDQSRLLAYIEDNYVSDIQDEELSVLLEGTDVLQEMKADQTSKMVESVEVEETTQETEILQDIDESDIESYLDEEYSVDELIEEL